MNSQDAINQFKKIFGTEPAKVVSYAAGDKDFANYHAAARAAQELGYSEGSMCAGEPIGLAKGKHSIAKWHSINPSAYVRLDGVLLSDSFRNGEVFLCLK